MTCPKESNPHKRLMRSVILTLHYTRPLTLADLRPVTQSDIEALRKQWSTAHEPKKLLLNNS